MYLRNVVNFVNVNNELISYRYAYLDNEAPDFETCPFNQTLNTKPGLPTIVAIWQHPSATDNSGDKPIVTCNPMSGSNFTIGQTLVTCEAVDSSGNNNTCTFKINVKGTLELCFLAFWFPFSVKY